VSIPETQLTIWSHQGAIQTSAVTHESIRRALTATGSPLNGKDFEVYLQGSYKNDTNIRGDSDVDVVVELSSTFQYDLDELAEANKSLFQQSFPAATYTWRNFRSDVLLTLRTYFGSSAIIEGNKCIKIAGGNGRLPADVVPCLEYRKYQTFRSMQDQRYVPGIVFYTQRENRRVINFPKPHYANGVAKHQGTNSWYKPTVRIFKNMRTYLIDHNMLSNEMAPSYFLECLIYNVPNSNFGSTYQNTFCNAVNWLNACNLDDLLCQNGQLPLFGGTPEQWSTTSARTLIAALISLWNNWYNG
jgi:hypothetical protein